MLARDGWCVFGRAVEPALIAGIEADLDARFAATPLCQGAFYGERTKRFGSLLTRSPAMERLAMHPLVLEIVEQMLLPWCERVALNLTQAIEIHPGALPQLPHRDQDMWQGPKGNLERSEEQTSELKSLMRNSYADFCFKNNNKNTNTNNKKTNTHKYI